MPMCVHWNLSVCVLPFARSLARSLSLHLHVWMSEWMFLLEWHNTAWLKEKTRWLLLLSNSVLEPQCRTHKHMHTITLTRIYRCLPLCECSLCVIRTKWRRKNNKTTSATTTTTTVWILFLEYVHCAFSYSAQKHYWLKTFSQRVTHVWNGRGRCRHHYYERLSEREFGFFDEPKRMRKESENVHMRVSVRVCVCICVC